MDPLPDELRQVLAGDGKLPVGDGAGDVQQAAAVARNHPRRAGRQDVVHLVMDHGARDGGVLDGEGPAESAALALALELHQFDVRQLPDQALGILDDPHLPQGVAGGVPGDFQGVASVLEPHTEHPHHELGPLEHAGGKPLGLGLVRRAGKERRVVVFHHPGAGPGGHHDGDVFMEGPDLPAGDGPGFSGKAGVVGRLPAAGLAARKDHPHTFAFDQPDGGQARLGVKRVDQAGAEEIDPGGSR
jgi:hypothetical protein